MHATPTLSAPSHLGSKCSATTKSGRPCPWKVDGEGSLCWRHDPARAEERRERLAALGARGSRTRKQNRVRRATAVSLATTGAIRSLLEETAAEVRASGGDVCTKAGVTVRICTAALDALKTADLERQVEELRQLVEARTGRLAS